MTEIQTEAAAEALLDIKRLIRNESSLVGHHISPEICITDNYRYLANGELPLSARQTLSSLIEQTQAEGFLLPQNNSSFSLIPIRGALCSVMEQASTCLGWNEATSLVRADELKRLFTHGVLGVRLAQGVVTGAAAHVLVASKEDGVVPDALSTDPLSWEALNHIARLPVTDPMALTSRLYSYNSQPRVKTTLLREVIDRVKNIAESDWTGVFKVRTPSPDNPGWYLFGNTHRDERTPSLPHSAKVYISPVVNDVPQCLSRLIEILPSVQFEAWKIGRNSYGIARSDKICVYFKSLELAKAAARRFASELKGFEAQGVPFTQRQDSTGLISIGIDPLRPKTTPRFAIQNSWRLWVARKMGSAMAVAKSAPQYPLSPEQAALWAVHFLGINPLSWTVEDINFWRN